MILQLSIINCRQFQTFKLNSNQQKKKKFIVLGSQQVGEQLEQFVCEQQKQFICEIEKLDGSGKKFVVDKWGRGEQNQGYGITAVLENGQIFEKGAVNVSVIKGKLSSERAWTMSERGRNIDPEGGQEYSAVALSTIFHMAHPMIPTLRADIRMFQVENEVWFGGGADLTPYYLYEEDVVEFHSFWKELCSKYDLALYPEYKAWCDRYFYLPAREEHRGVGGIFFDDLEYKSHNFDEFEFVKDVGQSLLLSWLPIIDRRRNESFSQQNKDWQVLRRGRYLEFNLLYDRGVKFGLKGGRMESIMVSAPPMIAFKYNVVPQPGSQEEKLVEILRQPRDWV
eukprot:TRINITY_DN25401_c0_g1_i1.p1 TRINITY_DN25401_c0_g1~~TRINITY_DN25401_c0_g1_i1.p1  ORF type:complete len:338 (+),score=51.67 TRINITY_DN25401_c0_g1_i1:185-1198(+)